MRTCYVNGQWIPETEAKISIYDAWAMYGECAFEMTRSFDGRHFQLMEHMTRLYDSLKILALPEPMPQEALYHLCLETAKRNEHGKGTEHRLMVNISRGPLGIYHDAAPLGPTVTISDFPLHWTTRGLGRLFTEGIHAVTPSQLQIPSSYLDAKAKHRSRGHFAMANYQVSLLGDDRAWALLQDDRGRLCEGTGANLMLLKNGIIRMPHWQNALPGISAKFLAGLAKQHGYEVGIGLLEPYDLITAEEAWFTATPFCMLPITTYMGRPVGSGKVGPVFQELLAYWGEAVGGIEIDKQIQAWDKLFEAPAVSSPYQAVKR